MVKNWKRIIELIIVLLLIFITSLTLTLILNKDIRLTIGKRIQEIFKTSDVETKVDYEIEKLARRKLKCILTNRKPKWNR